MARGINVPGLVAAIDGGRSYAGRPLMSGLTDVSCAAWLTWRFRGSLLRAGMAEVNFMPGQAPERWFLLGIDVLKQRQRWNVVVLARPGRVRTFRLQWLGWGEQRGRVGRCRS